MNRVINEPDRIALTRCAVLLDLIGRRSTRSSVALNCLSAAHSLAHADIDASEAIRSETYRGDEISLLDVLALFAATSDQTHRDEDVLSALDHVLLAHVAAR